MFAVGLIAVVWHVMKINRRVLSRPVSPPQPRRPEAFTGQAIKLNNDHSKQVDAVPKGTTIRS